MRFFRLFLVLIFSIVNVYSQNDDLSNRPIPFNWQYYNQREKIKTLDGYRFRYVSINQDNSFIKIYDTQNPKEFYLELSTDASQQKITHDIELPNSIEIPDNGSVPKISKTASTNADRNILFEYIGQEILVKTGEKVNITYTEETRTNTSIKYTSVEEGYILQLLELQAATPVKFTKLCESYIVSSPSKTIIEVDESLRYDQIIWTPLENGQWEVRMGTHDRDGCPSPALEAVRKLQTPEYRKKQQRLRKK